MQDVDAVSWFAHSVRTTAHLAKTPIRVYAFGRVLGNQLGVLQKGHFVHRAGG